MMGADFDSFILEKVVAIAGDVSLVKLGIKDANLEKKIVEDTDIIDFSHRYNILKNLIF